jgi:hypothetical protein
MGEYLVILYRIFKWSIFLAILAAFMMSGQCQSAINDICHDTDTCEPDFEREDRLFGKKPGTSKRMREKND